MNIDVLILFFNATLVTIISCVVVIGILKKQYLPVIQEEENKQRNAQNNNRANETITNDPEQKEGVR
ncbi:hypothetical protein [Salinicoccus bachuensis]|uniref:Uncharacterized protein n=1 Tax=Salinicoccus bachuensis TaxID=3136731 RepID=A0ABZ3CJY4_9STAP